MRLIIVLFIAVNLSNSLAQKDWNFGVMTSLGLGYRVFQSQIAGLEDIRKVNDYAHFNYSFGLAIKYYLNTQNSFTTTLTSGKRGFKSNNLKESNNFYDIDGQVRSAFSYVIPVYALDIMYRKKIDVIPSEPWIGAGLQGSFYRNPDYKLLKDDLGWVITRPNFGSIVNISWDLEIFKKGTAEIGVFCYVDFRSNQDIEPIRNQAKIWLSGCSAFVKYYF